MSRTKQLAARSPGHRQQAGEEKDTNSRHSSSEKTEAGSVSGVVRVSEVKSDGKSCMRASVRLPFLAPVAPLCETPRNLIRSISRTQPARLWLQDEERLQPRGAFVATRITSREWHHSQNYQYGRAQMHEVQP